MVEQPVHFTDGAAYERTMGVWSQLVGEIFLDWLALPPGLRWIDVGCGSGAFTELFVRRCVPSETQGIDPSEAQLAFARTRPATRDVVFLQGDAMVLPFASDRFDVAIMALVIFFLSDPVKGVAEMARVVCPGGTVATYAWDILGGGFPLDPIQVEMRAIGVTPQLPPSVGASRMETLRDMWIGAGLEAVETHSITVERMFCNFEKFWAIMTMAPTLQMTLATMTSGDVDQLEARVRARLPADAAGRIVYPARANAIKGRLPA